MWLQWIVGFGISLVAGQLVVSILLYCVRRHLGKENDPLSGNSKIREVPAWLIGLSERLFFSVIIAFGVLGAAVSMIPWIAVKMVTTWHRLGQMKDNPWTGPFALSSLLGNLVSMLFALFGGLVCRGQIWQNIIQYFSS
jgi:undecaprenyl pyrophosphate phosphatase UppP